MLSRLLLLSLFALTLVGCGFKLRQQAELPQGMQRIFVDTADPYNPLKRNMEDALRRSGATIETKEGEGVAELKIPVAAITSELSALGPNQHVREFVLIYHVDFEIVDFAGKILVAKQSVELTRDFTFDDTQALGISVEQDQLTRQMQRDMVQSLMRRIDTAGKNQNAAH